MMLNHRQYPAHHKFVGIKEMKTKVNLIESTLPQRPINSKGHPGDYHARHYRQLVDMITIVRALFDKTPPRNPEDTRLICSLRYDLKRCQRKHQLIKESNKELRQRLKA